MCHKNCKPATEQCQENQSQNSSTSLLYLQTQCHYRAKPNFSQNQCQDQFLFHSDSLNVKLCLMLNDIPKYASCAARQF